MHDINGSFYGVFWTFAEKSINFIMCFEGVVSRCAVIYDADFLKCETVWRKTYVSEPTQSQAERSQVEPARARQPGRDRPPGRARHSDGSEPGSQAEPGRASQPRIFIEPALCQFVPKLRIGSFTRRREAKTLLGKNPKHPRTAVNTRLNTQFNSDMW